MAGLEYQQIKPFQDVYFTGMVRDKQGRKMSKSLGNSPDLLSLIDKYGADAVRFGIMISSPAGNDLLFDEGSLEQGRNFNNKLWNALKLVKSWENRSVQSAAASRQDFAISWFESRLQEVQAGLERDFAQYRLSEALKNLYSLIWDDFCSFYLEWVKPGYEQPIDANTLAQTISFYEQLLHLLNPFMPFITEEIYHLLRKRTDDLCVKTYPPMGQFDPLILQQGEDLKLFLSTGREFRQQNGLKQATPIKALSLPSTVFGQNPAIYSIIEKQLHIEKILFDGEALVSGDSLESTTLPFKFFQIRFETAQLMDSGKRKEELHKELAYYKGFVQSVEKKLLNERFLQNAKPEVIAIEQKKKADAEGKILAIQESLTGL